MIDYVLIANSIHYYEHRKYSRIEAPWTVSKAVSGITKPEGCIDYQLVHNGKVLVGSGEQSFLYLYLKGFLPKGKFQTVTPCFRDETFDHIHTKYFIKNELIVTDRVGSSSLCDVVDDAMTFFQSCLGTGVSVVENAPDQVDLVWNGIELGSYGIRSCDFLEWIYGTGCAEPRLSFCINKRDKQLANTTYKLKQL